MAKRWFINAKLKKCLEDCASHEAQLFYSDHICYDTKKEAEKALEETFRHYPEKRELYDFNFFRKEVVE